ncbi:MAG: hypothetical protein LBE91_17210 [Tannerella sp.]|jgi:hypothetical protein|nr:hypothetical protein [Tannerella sp.]
MDGLFLFLMFILVAAVLAFWIYFCTIPAKITEDRGRSYWEWFFLSVLLISPLLGIILLADLGDMEERREDKIIQDEELRMRVRNGNNTDGESYRRTY